MPIFTVDLSCRSSDFDYTGLFETLRSANAISFMDARWLIDVSDDLNTVTAALLARLAPGDRLFVTELAPETRWSGTGLKDEVKAWFRARMTAEPAEPAPVEPVPKQPGRGHRSGRSKAG